MLTLNFLKYQRQNLDILVWIVGWVVGIGAIASTALYLRDNSSLQKACVKVERFEWVFSAGRGQSKISTDLAYAWYSVPGKPDQIVKSRKPWFGQIHQGVPFRSEAAERMLTTACVEVWYKIGLEDTASPDRTELPFLKPFGMGQWMLFLLCAVALIRALAYKVRD